MSPAEPRGPAGAEDGSLGDARLKGRVAIEALRQRLTERAAALINEHPDFARGAAEVGLVDRAWLEDPIGRPIRTATSLEVVQRFLERSVEQDPSLVAKVGLDALQALASADDETGEDGVTVDTTIVFTDLEGFTSYTARSGDAAARELLEEHHRAVGPIVRSRGGRLVKTLGDGLLLTFPDPVAAVLATIELVETNATSLRIRGGIHHGEVVQLRDDVIGHDVNVAARVTDSAKGGELLVTTDLRARTGPIPGITYGRARRRRFKGVDGSILVCPVSRTPEP